LSRSGRTESGRINTTVSTFEVDEAGLHAVLAPRSGLTQEEADGPNRFRCAEGPFDEYERLVSVEDMGPGRHMVTETTNWWPAIPLWRGLFTPLLRKGIARTEAPAGAEAEAEQPAPWWSPPARLDARATRILSLLCGLSMLAGYLATVLTQTITFAADQFGATKSAQGNTLAAVRVGVLFSLVLMTIADRKGRKKLLIVSAVGGTLATAAGALSPNLVVLGATQTVSRSFATALALLLTITAAEEMPAGGRAYAASVLAMTAALGAGGAVILLPVADLSPWAWRIIYLAPLAALPFFLKVGKIIPESRRFVHSHIRASMTGHRGRLGLLCASTFCGLMFLAPVSQFQNDYLRNEHGFSALMITVYTLATNTPAGIGIVVGGRLADIRGRRVVGAVGTIGGAAFLALAYQVSGPWLWFTALIGTILAAVTVPALTVYGPELFPTSLRGRANGIITLAGVGGSAVGLALAGALGDHYGRLGVGMAILLVGPVVVAVLVLTLYPETANVELEELNPEDTSPVGWVTPLD